MTHLRYTIATWHMRSSQSEQGPPFAPETLELSAAESGIVVDKDLLWRPSFVKYRL